MNHLVIALQMYNFSSSFYFWLCKFTKMYYICSPKPIIDLWCNGSTAVSGSACLGSNPGKSTKFKVNPLIINKMIRGFLLGFKPASFADKNNV